MAVIGALNVSRAEIRRPSSIEDKIWDGEGTSVSATVSRTLGAGRGLQQTRASRGGVADHSKAAFLQRHFWVGNAPYSSNDPGNLLIFQQMRPPSERTTPHTWR